MVLNDAGSLDRVAAHGVTGAFWKMGETCSTAFRLIVQRGVKDAFLDRSMGRAGEWPMGDPT